MNSKEQCHGLIELSRRRENQAARNWADWLGLGRPAGVGGGETRFEGFEGVVDAERVNGLSRSITRHVPVPPLWQAVEWWGGVAYGTVLPSTDAEQLVKPLQPQPPSIPSLC